MNEEETYILPREELPAWFSYPSGFVRVVQQNLVDLTPWHVMDVKYARRVLPVLSSRYPARRLLPFAYRRNNDDVACWESGCGERVFVVHDFADEGAEREGEFANFWDWFRAAVEEMIEWE